MTPGSATAPTLSVVIPVYNEAGTIGLILAAVTRALPEVPKQIIIVDDCSTDGTARWLRRNLGTLTLTGRSATVLGTLDDISRAPNSADG